MMSNMLADLRLYGHLVTMQLRAQMQYKLNALIDIITYLSVTGLEFVPVLIYQISGKRATAFRHVGEWPPVRRRKLDKFS